MSFTVFLGNLPAWVTKDDIKSWLNAETLVFDDVKVIRNPETQESKGFAFIDTPNSEEMNSIIRRFDRAPLEDRLLRANQAQPPRSKVQAPGTGASPNASQGTSSVTSHATSSGTASGFNRPPVAAGQAGAASPAALDRGPRRERGGKKHKRAQNPHGPQSAFAEELAKAL